MPKFQTLEAIDENGVLRPLKALDGFVEHSQVKITIECNQTPSHPLLQFAGIISNEEATELQRIVTEEFGKIDTNLW